MCPSKTNNKLPYKSHNLTYLSTPPDAIFELSDDMATVNTYIKIIYIHTTLYSM